MAELFKSAVNYLSGSGNDPENEFLGKVVVLGRHELRVKKLLGGGERVARRQNGRDTSLCLCFRRICVRVRGTGHDKWRRVRAEGALL